MTGLSPGGGHAGHPDLVGCSGVVLKVTTIGRDPLRAAAHGGGNNFVSSGTLNGDETNIQAGPVRRSLHLGAAPPILFAL